MFSGLGAASSAQAAIYAQRALTAYEKSVRANEVTALARPVRLADLVEHMYPLYAERNLTCFRGVPVVGLEQAVREHGTENVYLAPGRLLVVREGRPHIPRVPRKQED